MKLPFRPLYLKNLILLLSFLCCFQSNVWAQESVFEIEISPIEIPHLGGLQSYAYGQINGKWLIVGGRLDGLHRRQPWATFDEAGNNNKIIVVDPLTKESWSASTDVLPVTIAEQLSSTNMESYQQGKYLYCLGGYGYSASQGNHTTYDQLVAIDVEQVINAIVSEKSFAQYFRAVKNELFQVTGGKLKKLNDHFYLLGGQKFIGRYNPHGPEFGPGFIQEYTNAIRIFDFKDDGKNISIKLIDTWIDVENLHRRDYNAEAQIFPDKSKGITMFSGVFQKDVDLPYLNTVDVSESGYTVNNEFEQYFNHYHCPVFTTYSEANNKMYTVFFGGIAQFYIDEEGDLVQDDNVPFVKTIACVTRDSLSVMKESRLSVEMPEWLGAGAEFIVDTELPHYSNGVVKLDSIALGKTKIGYIFGGIRSDADNIFYSNNGTQSHASNQVFEVYLNLKD